MSCKPLLLVVIDIGESFLVKALYSRDINKPQGLVLFSVPGYYSQLFDVEHAIAQIHRYAALLSKVYPVNEDDAWKIAKKVFRWEGTDAIEEYRDEGYMLTSSGMNLVSYGAVMGAWIERIDEEKTKVTVVTKRRISTNVFTTMTHGRFHELFSRAVQIVKSGQPLPLACPG